MPSKIIEKVGAVDPISWLGWLRTKWTLSSHPGENYDIAFANNYVVNAQKGAYADLTELYKKEGKTFTTAQLYQREHCKRQDLCCSSSS